MKTMSCGSCYCVKLMTFGMVYGMRSKYQGNFHGKTERNRKNMEVFLKILLIDLLEKLNYIKYAWHGL